jgi:glutamate/tyrosine decarboxylase-like PLP-dependent enzyme
MTHDDILARLDALRAADAPTHGGRVLSYVYDSGSAELDSLAAAAMQRVQPVNGLDPTTFTSVAVMEGEVVGFMRSLLGGDDEVVGSVTTGGTESCLLAVKTARDNWTGFGKPRLVAPVTVHAAFHKAAHYFGLTLDLVPVGPDGTVSAAALIERMGSDTAIVVVSAPSYPFATMDPIVEVAAAALERGISCHVDACIGGLVLPFWRVSEPWDLRVPGVTSISADLHKFGYAPKGVSVLLQRGRDRQRAQYFATTGWPGYPVINATMLGSKSAGPLAAAWAIIQALGTSGFADFAESCARSTAALIDVVGSIDGLRVVGTPTGPLFAVETDPVSSSPVDPHHWADQVREHGFFIQQQPGLTQADGSRLPHTTHLTVTPVTESVLGELSTALVTAAEEVRGWPQITAAGALPPLPTSLDSETAVALLRGLGIGDGPDGLPPRMAPLLALIEALPAPLVERLLTELLARVVEPR